MSKRRENRKRCWRVLQEAVVHEAVHRVCISVDSCVKGGVENLWINAGRDDISAAENRTTRHIQCGQQSPRRVGPGYRAGRVGFRADFRRVKGRLSRLREDTHQIVRQKAHPARASAGDFRAAENPGGRARPHRGHERLPKVSFPRRRRWRLRRRFRGAGAPPQDARRRP